MDASIEFHEHEVILSRTPTPTLFTLCQVVEKNTGVITSDSTSIFYHDVSRIDTPCYCQPKLSSRSFVLIIILYHGRLRRAETEIF